MRSQRPILRNYRITNKEAKRSEYVPLRVEEIEDVWDEDDRVFPWFASSTIMIAARPLFVKRAIFSLCKTMSDISRIKWIFSGIVLYYQPMVSSGDNMSAVVCLIMLYFTHK
jgi:hypothetical protein